MNLCQVLASGHMWHKYFMCIMTCCTSFAVPKGVCFECKWILLCSVLFRAVFLSKCVFGLMGLRYVEMNTHSNDRFSVKISNGTSYSVAVFRQWTGIAYFYLLCSWSDITLKYFPWHNSPLWSRASSLSRFYDHTQTHYSW